MTVYGSLVVFMQSISKVLKLPSADRDRGWEF